jgi:hypothetical protein
MMVREVALDFVRNVRALRGRLASSRDKLT